jgi:hypothetical protein
MKVQKKVTVGNFAKKGEDFKDGDLLTILDAGQVVTGNYGEQYVFLMRMPSGDERNVTVNQTSMNKLIDGNGDDTEGWKGKKVRAWLNRENVSGKFVQVLYLTMPNQDLEGNMQVDEDAVEDIDDDRDYSA